jgi:hypothetical protein
MGRGILLWLLACPFRSSYSSLFSITDAAALANFALDFRGDFSCPTRR